MIATPTDDPVTTPVEELTCTTELLLVHVPPWVPLVTKVIVDPTQTEDPPEVLLIVPASSTVICKLLLVVPQEFDTV